MKNGIHVLRSYCSHLLRLVSLLVVCLLAWTTALGQPTVELNARAKGQITALLREKATRTPVQQKISSQLLYAAKQRRQGFISEDAPKLKLSLQFEKDGGVEVDIDAVVSDALLDAIKAAGGRNINSFPADNAIRAVLPQEQIESLAARNDIRFIKPAVRSMTNTGSVNSQGDVAHRSNQARATYGATGVGIKVGVLSDSIDNTQGSFAAAKASGDCPTNLTIIPGQAGQGDGEGLAMLEIVHDLAPNAQLYFASGGGQTTEAQMAQNIRSLATAGCRVIIDDITFYDESPFQDGIISKAVNDVSAQGVLFFSSAANSGNLNDGTSGTWEGDFVDGGDASFYDGGSSRFHAFAQGSVYNQSTQTGNRTILFWSDALGHSANDYDLFVVDSLGNVVTSSTDSQTGTQNPIEGVDPAASGNYVVIIKFSGAGRFLHLATNRGRLFYSTSGCTYGHNASGAANAFSVAATSAEHQSGAFTGGAANPVENFSSDGFRHIFYNADGSAITAGNFSSTGGKILLKPDLTAADGVTTTLPGNSGLNPFFGTSAAAPHAGAIAAQLLSYRPSLTPAEVRAAMKASCLNIEATGFDRDSGSGIVMTLQALQHLPPVPTATDFNHDGKTDFVLRNSSTRDTAIWYLNNNVYFSGASGPTLPVGWSLIDIGDFNRDGKPDYSLFNAGTRHSAIWYLNNNVYLSGKSGPTLPAGWSLVGLGDFNRDGKTDDLLFNAGTRHTAIWYLNNNVYVSGLSGPTLPAGWRIAGVADFNRDGKPDYLLFNASTRNSAIWYLNNNAYVSGRSGPTLPAGWSLVGTADFNRNSRPDYSLVNAGTRHTAIWYLNDNVYLSGASGPTLPAGWVLVKP